MTLFNEGGLFSEIAAGGGGEGTTDYNKLTSKPSINKNTLQGNKTGDSLGLIDKAQGVSNQGKILSVASDGNLSLSDPKEAMSGIKYTEPEELFDVIEFNNINYDTDIKNVPTLNGVSLKGTLTSESVKVVGSQQNKSSAGKVLGIDVNGKVVPVNASSDSAVASGVLVDNKDFQILTGANVQVALKEVDTNLVGIAKKADKVVVKTISNGTVALVNNTILRASGSNALTNLTVTAPSPIVDDFTCELDFTSGANATAFTAPSTIKWFGDDVESGALVPQVKTRYVIIFYYEGTTIRAVSQKAGV